MDMDIEELTKRVRAELARQGGEARARSLSATERKRIATKASKAAAKARTAKAKSRKQNQLRERKRRAS
jgi:hypothetical protein